MEKYFVKERHQKGNWQVLTLTKNGKDKCVKRFPYDEAGAREYAKMKNDVVASVFAVIKRRVDYRPPFNFDGAEIGYGL